MMDFERFTNEIAENIKMYLPPEYAGAEVDLQKVIKNNDMELTGIMIRDGVSNITPNIYLDGYYDKYIDGVDMENIMQAIANVRVRGERADDLNINMFKDLDLVKDKIVCKLVNEEMNTEYLKNKPYTKMEDLAVIYAIDLGGSEFGHMTTPITQKIMQDYGINKEELHKIAMDNLANSQIEFKSLRDVLVEMMFPDGISEDDPRMCMLPPEEETPTLYVLSNQDNVNGASAMLDSKTMESISEQLGGDFIILPSSLHEVLITPVTDRVDRRMLEDIVRNVNSSEVAPEDRLSDNVYMYDSVEKELVLADKMEERRQQREEAKLDAKQERPDKADRSDRKPERERVSMKEKIAEKKAIVTKNEATREHPVVNKARDTALA